MITKTSLLPVFIVCGMLSCARSSRQTSISTPTGNPAAISRQSEGRAIKVIRSPITEISVVQEPVGLDNLHVPAYAVTLRSDGTAIYVGKSDAVRNGTY